MPKPLFWIPLISTLSAIFLLAACSSGEPNPTATAYPTFPPPTATPGPVLPGTTGASMISYLAEVDYRSNWRRWPGLGEKYPSTGGHSVLLTTYVNPAARAAITGKEGAMRPNSIIVKDSFTEEGEFRVTTVMYKVEGYNPQHNDWFWLKVLEDGTIEIEGTPDGCIVCHAEKRSNDYIWIGGPTSLSK